ncbi:hypothetical protein ACFOU2_21000 [Bacillus songklensis]|uniref:Uncharacterized protein n=1 Tax=Bacillus songklensis TaxID=1069116 RepID=A0ABV8B913_9BACI
MEGIEILFIKKSKKLLETIKSILYKFEEKVCYTWMRGDYMNGFKKEITKLSFEEPESLKQFKHYMEQSLWNLRKDLRNPNRSKIELEMIKISTVSLLEKQAKQMSEMKLDEYFSDYIGRVEKLFERYIE